MSKGTLQLAKKIRDTLRYVSECTGSQDWVPRESFYGHDFYKEAYAAFEKAKDLTQFAYEEERIEEILQRVIEKNKAVLVELIKQDNSLKEEEKRAIEAVQRMSQTLKEINERYPRNGHIYLHIDALREVLQQLNIIIGLLEKDAQIEQALSVVAGDLASLVSILPRGEK